MDKNNLNKGEIAIYKNQQNEVELKVKLEKETVWLSLDQMTVLFDRDKSVISRHIHNVFQEKELDKNSVVAKSATTAADGKIYQVIYYNLDVIISIGYRVKSQNGVKFRIWASRVLKQYLIQGYVINEKRLLETQNKFRELQDVIMFLQKQSQKELLIGQRAEILSLLADYSKTMSLLGQYDKGSLLDKKGQKAKFLIQFQDCVRIIIRLKKELVNRKEVGDLFGQERNESFSGIIAALYQTFDKQELYPSIEDKAAHLLYLTIKDHPFSDGNKRIAAFLFVYFLDKSDYLFKKSGERKINDNALTALSLLIAESDPKDKNMMIKIIKNLLTE